MPIVFWNLCIKIVAPKKLKRDPSRLFISFRPAENVKNEVSVTNGYEFKLKAPVIAKSGKKSYDLFSKGRFAWVVDNEDEKRGRLALIYAVQNILKNGLYLLGISAPEKM